MTTQRVTELQRALEPVSPDTFVKDLDQAVRRADGGGGTPDDDGERQPAELPPSTM